MYISNDARRFHVFVANRVQQIRTSPDQWRYGESSQNPADEASRGLDAQELIQSSSWWNGPDFLWKESDPRESIESPPDDPEVKQVLSFATHIQEYDTLLKRSEYFSEWHRAKKGHSCVPSPSRKVQNSAK